jgi:hypothetical protein
MSNQGGRGSHSIQPTGSNNFGRGRGYGRGDRDFRGGPNPRFMRGRGGQGYGGPRFGGPGGDEASQRENFIPRGGFRGRGNYGPNGQPPPDGMFQRDMNFSRGRGGPRFTDFQGNGHSNFSQPPRGSRMGDTRRGRFDSGGGQPATRDFEVNNDQTQYDQQERRSFRPRQSNMWPSNRSQPSETHSMPQSRIPELENDLSAPSSFGGYRSANEMTHDRNFQR